jgi:hypothetical protein
MFFSSTTITSMGEWSISATASGSISAGEVALDGLVFFRRSFLALAFFHSQVIRKRQDSSSDESMERQDRAHRLLPTQFSSAT